MSKTNKGKGQKRRAYSSGWPDIRVAIYGGYSRSDTDTADKKDPPNHTEGQDHEHDE
jgi:hypothetical protein